MKSMTLRACLAQIILSTAAQKKIIIADESASEWGKCNLFQQIEFEGIIKLFISTHWCQK